MKRIFVFLSAVIIALLLPCAAYADSISPQSAVYEFSEKSGYEISSAVPINTPEQALLGEFSVEGEAVPDSDSGDIPEYIVPDGGALTLKYTYSPTLANASEEDWHLISDSKKSVDGIDLGGKIETGAVIFQTSLDGEKWTVNKIVTDLENNANAEYSSLDIQLNNGCFYRVIVAYELEKKTDPTKILFVNKNNYERKKVAEVYEFYAGYESAKSKPDEKKFTLGKVVNTSKDNGYSDEIDIDKDDPHYGWTLGEFYVSGFTSKTDGNVFLKNVGDRVTLWFKLEQDIDCLNGNEKLVIADDKDGYDKYFQTPQTDFGRGTLIIRKTDYEGHKGDPIIYQNYLEALTSASADVKIQLFEEGDYEVALDYEILDSKGINKKNDYRIFFTFSVRNGNCMVYPFDVATGSELSDSSVTENGFRLDLAKSRYLLINVTHSVWTKGANGYAEDVRFNRPAKDGDKYTDEGIYTIEVKNPTTGSNTVKKIYVGSDSVMKASMNAANSVFTLDEIAAMVEQGAVINDDGRIVMPTVAESTEPEPEVTEAAVTTAAEITETPETEAIEAEADEPEAESKGFPAVAVIIFAVIIIVGAAAVVRSRKG